jgi:hypothetical protein
MEEVAGIAFAMAERAQEQVVASAEVVILPGIQS